jgi:hypothetical protein
VVDSFRLQAVDPGAGEPQGNPIDLQAVNTRVVVDDEGVVWLTTSDEDFAARITPAGSFTDLVMPGDEDPVGIALSNGRAWISSTTPDFLVPFDKDGKRGEPVETPCSLYKLVGVDGSVWGPCDKGLVRFDTETRRVTLIDTGGEPEELAATTSAMWALVGDRLVAVDLVTGQVANSMSAPDGALSIAGAGDNLWVVSQPDDRRPDQITRHAGSDAKLMGGPVDLPGSTSDVPTQARTMTAYGNDLWLTQRFYGAALVVVRPAA